MLLIIMTLLIGLILLIWSADRFITGSVAIASHFGLSPLLIGLTLVALGTSAPEMIVSIIAALNGNPNLGIGNAIGSNITNIGLVLGITALCLPLKVHASVYRRDLPMLFAIMVGSGLLLINGYFSRLDGALLLLGLLGLLAWLTYLSVKTQPHTPPELHGERPAFRKIPFWRGVMWFLIGLAVLLVSARILVSGAVSLAQLLGVSDLVIGLTVIAIGTSLPELAASLTGVIKKHHDIAIGNVLGSNMFNLLGVLAFPGLLAPGRLEPAVLTRDYPVMLGMTVLLMLLAFRLHKEKRLNRVGGAVLLLGYGGYLVFLAGAN